MSCVWWASASIFSYRITLWVSGDEVGNYHFPKHELYWFPVLNMFSFLDDILFFNYVCLHQSFRFNKYCSVRRFQKSYHSYQRHDSINMGNNWCSRNRYFSSLGWFDMESFIISTNINNRKSTVGSSSKERANILPSTPKKSESHVIYASRGK